MSAPTTHDPLVVNTQDGAVWMRRAVNRQGRGLYAVADAPACCPEFVMATLTELAEHGLASMAFALPVPAGNEPQAVDPGPVVRPLVLLEAQIDALAASGNRVVNDEMHQRLCMCDGWPEKCVSTGNYFMGAWDVSGLETALPAVLGLWESMRGSELVKLRARVAELEAERHVTNEALSDAAVQLRADRDRIAELEAQRERRRLRLIALQNDALSMRGSLSPMGETRKVPFPLGETLTPAVDWLIARVAELEALTPAAIQTCRVCGAGYSYGNPCSNCLFRAEMAAELKTRGLEDPHDSPLYHAYKTPRDLPGLGGQR